VSAIAKRLHEASVTADRLSAHCERAHARLRSHRNLAPFMACNPVPQ